MAREDTSFRLIDVWECIGCGRIEGPQPCVGICEDRKVSLVYASDYEAALARVAEAEERLAGLESLALRLTQTKPRADAYEASFRALQDEARRTLAALAAPRKARAAAEAEEAEEAHRVRRQEP